MKHFFWLSVIISLLTLQSFDAGAQAQQFINQKDWSFVANKGQLTDESGTVLSDIKFYDHQGGVNLYCRPGMLSFVFVKTEPVNQASVSEASGARLGGVEGVAPQNKPRVPTKVTTERTDLMFLNANASAQIMATGEQDYYENFYTTGSANHGITDVPTYNTVTYKDLYPHIDLVLQPKPSGVEYSFIVHPGGKVGQIKLQWQGILHGNTAIDGGFMHLCNLGYLSESRPVCFSMGKKVPSHFHIKESGYGFSVKGYDETKDLVIDPTIEWSTYYGGSSGDASFKVSVDNAGFIYFGGFTSSSSSIATSGTYKTYLSGYNAFLCKFNAAGKRQWGTYYGGGTEYVGGISCQTPGCVYITGQTFSTSGIATSGAYQTAYGGGTNYGDGFLAKFTSAGKLNWATYFGGSDDDASNGIGSDASGNVSITGYTQSKKNIATSGAFQTTIRPPAAADNFLALFDSSGTIKWATYYGGRYNEEAYSSTMDAAGNIYIVGWTYSDSGIATSGVYCSTAGGFYATSFLAKFNKSGNLSWGTYFGGIRTFATAVVADASNFVYITGTTTGNADSLATSGAYQTALASSYYNDAFLAKFTSAGALVWSTLYGGNDDDEGEGIALDTAENVAISGFTHSTKHIATTGAPQKNIGGKSDAYLAQFDKNGKIKWATYFGGPGDEQGNGVAADRAGNIYLSGYTESTSRIASPYKAYQSGIGGTEDAYLAKFRMAPYPDDAGIDSFASPLANNCTGSYPVKVYLRNFSANILKSATIGWLVNGSAQTSVSWTGSLSPDSAILVTLSSSYSFSTGANTIVAYSSLPNGNTDSATFNDTAFLACTINPHPLAKTGGDAVICKGTAYTLGTTSISGHQYSWTSKPVGFSSSLANPTIQASATSKYYLTETIGATGCTMTDSATITVNPTPTGLKYSTKTICDLTSIAIGTSSVTGYNYKWSSVPIGSSSSAANQTVHPDSSTVYYLTETIAATDCSTVDTIKVNVNPAPLPGVGFSSTNCGAVTSAKIGTSPVSGYAYHWTSRPAGFVSSAADTFLSVGSTTTYTLNEKILATGCTRTDSITITINPLPKTNSIASSSVCLGDSLSLGAPAISGVDYAWSSYPYGFSSTQANPTVEPLATTDYIITASIRATGCASTDTAKITVNITPQAKTGGPKKVCLGSSLFLGDSVIAGDSYAWTSNPPGFTSSLAHPKASPSATTTYTLTETNTATGCHKKDSVVIKINPVPLAFTVSNKTLCYGNSIYIGTYPVAGNTYTWASAPKGFSASISNPQVTPTKTTTYYLTESNQATGCSKSDSVTISVNPMPAAQTISNTTVCSNTSLAIGSKPVSGSKYSWSSSSGTFIDTVANPIVKVIATTQYTLTETDTSTGCSHSNSVTITARSLPTAQTIPDTGICKGASLPIGATPVAGSSYIWTSNPSGFASTVSNPTVNPVADTRYYLTETNSFGCKNSSSVDVVVSPVPVAKTISDSSICAGTSIALGAVAVAGSTYSWSSVPSGFNNVSSNPTVAPTVSTTYTLTEKTNQGCTKTSSVAIAVKSSPNAYWSLDYTGQMANLHAADSSLADGAYTWEFGDGDLGTGHTIRHLYPKNKTYTVSLSVTGTDGCENTHDSDLDITVSGIGPFTAKFKGLSIFPNPFSTSTTISYSLTEKSDVQISLFDMAGKELGIIIHGSAAPGTYQTEINAEKYHLSPGMYLLKLMINGQVMERHIMKL